MQRTARCERRGKPSTLNEIAVTLPAHKERAASSNSRSQSTRSEQRDTLATMILQKLEGRSCDSWRIGDECKPVSRQSMQLF